MHEASYNDKVHSLLLIYQLNQIRTPRVPVPSPCEQYSQNISFISQRFSHFFSVGEWLTTQWSNNDITPAAILTALPTAALLPQYNNSERNMKTYLEVDLHHEVVSLSDTEKHFRKIYCMPRFKIFWALQKELLKILRLLKLEQDQN